MLIIGLCAYAETRLCCDASGGGGGAHASPWIIHTASPSQAFLNAIKCLFSIAVIYMFTGGTLFKAESKHCSDVFTQANNF